VRRIKHGLHGSLAQIEFSVADTGVGMTEQQSRIVFEPFTQADVTTTRKYGGTGLGLAIVSRFCELMSGTISVESKLGSGSRFVVRLPADMAEPLHDELQTAGAA
jgi:signal transduction histidine kinase